MTTANLTKALVANAKTDLDAVATILATAAADGKKPTIAALNEIMRRVDKARSLLSRANDGADQ